MVYNLRKGGNAMTEYLKNYIDQITKRLAECTELSDADDILAEHKDKIAFAFAKFFFNVFKLVFKRGTAHKKPVAQLVNILRRRQIEQFKHKVAAESGIGTHAAAREYPPERRFVRRRYAIPFASFRYQLYVLPIQQTAKLRKPAADRSVAYLHFLSKLCGGKPVIGLQKIQ